MQSLTKKDFEDIYKQISSWNIVPNKILMRSPAEDLMHSLDPLLPAQKLYTLLLKYKCNIHHYKRCKDGTIEIGIGIPGLWSSDTEVCIKLEPQDV